jgi:hypothetical protein
MNAKDARDARDNEEARQALLTAWRLLQEAVVELQFAESRAPDIREDLQAQIERLAQIAEAITNHARQR